MNAVLYPDDTNGLRERWHSVDSANYDFMTAQMRNYLDMLDRPLLTLCRGNVLEIATGTGRFLTKIRRLPEVSMAIGIDIASQMLQAASAKGLGQLTQGYAELLPFLDSSFDSVVCTFYSFRDINRPPAYGEVARVLRPGGHFGFTLRNFYIAYLEALWHHFLRHGRLPRSLRTLDGTDGVIFDTRDINEEVKEIERAGLHVREIKTLRFLPFLRRFSKPGYWSGQLGTKFGSDIIIIAEKR
jgi:ubiquinone/menaquinone biosynthesis C-methylase UbiE